jgi:hypothetical protein
VASGRLGQALSRAHGTASHRVIAGDGVRLEGLEPPTPSSGTMASLFGPFIGNHTVALVYGGPGFTPLVATLLKTCGLHLFAFVSRTTRTEKGCAPTPRPKGPPIFGPLAVFLASDEAWSPAPTIGDK